MNEFDPAFYISDSGVESVADTIRSKILAWITSRWLADLLVVFDGPPVTTGSLEDILERLETFSEKWDFRRLARDRGAPTDDQMSEGAGSARWLTDGVTELPQDVQARILYDADHLGLVHAQEAAASSYDYIAVLGGARLSCKLRSLRAAEIMHAGVRTGTIVLLGAARPVAQSERDATDTYAPEAADEFDLIVAGAREAFGFDPAVFEARLLGTACRSPSS